MSKQCWLLGMCVVFTQVAWAGRPLGTDDAGTADAGTCQIEGWQQRSRSDRALVVAPACGVAPGLEVGIDDTRRTGDAVHGAGLALKWLPQGAAGPTWADTTAFGDVSAGLKLSLAYRRQPGESWRHRDSNLLLLVSTKFNDTLTLHTNLGAIRNQAEKINAGLFNIALVATPNERVLLFAESQTNSRQATFGPTVNTIGGRWWVIKQRFGLDATASRAIGQPGATYTLGFGWYGLTL